MGIHLLPNMQAATSFNGLSLLVLASLINLMFAATMEHMINQISAVDDSTGYKKSGFSESSFDQAEGMKEMEEDIFPHEDLVRLAPPTSAPGTKSMSSNALGVWRPQSGHLLLAVSLPAIIGKGLMRVM